MEISFGRSQNEFGHVFSVSSYSSSDNPLQVDVAVLGLATTKPNPLIHMRLTLKIDSLELQVAFLSACVLIEWGDLPASLVDFSTVVVICELTRLEVVAVLDGASDVDWFLVVDTRIERSALDVTGTMAVFPILAFQMFRKSVKVFGFSFRLCLLLLHIDHVEKAIVFVHVFELGVYDGEHEEKEEDGKRTDRHGEHFCGRCGADVADEIRRRWQKLE